LEKYAVFTFFPIFLLQFLVFFTHYRLLRKSEKYQLKYQLDQIFYYKIVIKSKHLCYLIVFTKRIIIIIIIITIHIQLINT